MSGTMFNASKQPLRDIEASMVFSAALSVLLTLVVPISDTYNCLSYIFVYSPLLSMFAVFFFYLCPIAISDMCYLSFD